jgi:dTDP-4-dehydrorhamnose reductase
MNSTVISGGSRRYALLGAAGQLGRDLAARLRGEVLPLTRADADLTNAQQLRETLNSLQPQVVINCAAYNFVDKAEDEPEAAFAVNALAVRRLAEVCRSLDAVLVQFSTDYVFGLDEQRTQPYRESDAPGPVSVYGASKLAGEYFVRSTCPKHFVIRTCGLYGRWGTGGKGGNFVETMLRVASQGRPLRVVNDQILTPTATADLADAVIQLIDAPHFGVYHLTNSGHCSWYEFARSIFELRGISADLSPTTSAAYGSRARRPSYSVLATEHPHTPRMRSWREALADYLRQRKQG